VLFKEAYQNFQEFEKVANVIPDFIQVHKSGEKVKQILDILLIMVIVQEEVVELRLNKILRLEHPYLPLLDIQKIIEQRRKQNLSIHELINDFLTQRKQFLKLLENLPRDSWQRTGFHEVEGHVTFQELVKRMNEKDTRLIAQLKELVQGEVPQT
jgi:DNA-binding transcriptional MerR regulator